MSREVFDDEVKVQKLSHVVADRLRSQIVRGVRKPGEKLPSETELLQHFRVSRPTVREALRILEVESLIIMGRGMRSGATVMKPSSARASEYSAMVLINKGTSLGELHDARSVLEPEVVRQLAGRTDRASMEHMQSRLDRAVAALAARDFAGVIRALDDFHVALMQASSNRAVRLILAMVKDVSQQSIEMLVDPDFEDEDVVRGCLDEAIAAHRRLLFLLKSMRADEAHAFWRDHLQDVREHLSRRGVGARRISPRG